MESADQSNFRKCSICNGIDHNKRTCPDINFKYGQPSKRMKEQRLKVTMKQQTFYAEAAIIKIVRKIVKKGYFPTMSEFYRHCIMQELDHWIDLKELIQEAD